MAFWVDDHTKPKVWDQYPRVAGAILEKAFEECMPFILEEIRRSYKSNLFALSDRVIEEQGKVRDIGKETATCITAHFMRYLIANKIGSITLSPIIRNNGYAPVLMIFRLCTGHQRMPQSTSYGTGRL